MITKVTITGADNSIHPLSLLELSKKFPFVEWGILVSKNNTDTGSNRFPSLTWITELARLKNAYPELKLACHVCGGWVRDIFNGNFPLVNTLPLDIFERIQLNTHGITHEYNSLAFQRLASLEQEFIFQYDNANLELVTMAKENNVKHSALFDLSHGFGNLPGEWPELLEGTKCGYAGGLSPDNLEEQILLIEAKAGSTEIWIDMETHVRSYNDKQFDINKVFKCLEICKKVIN